MEPIVVTDNLWKLYRAGKVEVPALRGVNFKVLPGEFVTVVGPSGCGKSTLFNIVAGLEEPDAGVDAPVEAGETVLALMSEWAEAAAHGFACERLDYAALFDAIAAQQRAPGVGAVHPRLQKVPDLVKSLTEKVEGRDI